MRSDQSQYHEDEGETTKEEDLLLSEEVQFAKLEKSFREVGVWFYINLRQNRTCIYTRNDNT